ncbi:hypothetical protein ACRAWC_01530 [Leifsonia sp. L25]|uniref:hypothetical protein n=1 Tax=Actinomycetes TaxID=1760 RepID=UPI003D698441
MSDSESGAGDGAPGTPPPLFVEVSNGNCYNPQAFCELSFKVTNTTAARFTATGEQLGVVGDNGQTYIAGSTRPASCDIALNPNYYTNCYGEFHIPSGVTIDSAFISTDATQAHADGGGSASYRIP